MAPSRTLLCSLILSIVGIAHAAPEHPHYRNALPFSITTHPLDQHLRPRQTGLPPNPGPSICGYRNGELDRGWKAPAGSTCFIDYSASYFGFCNTAFTKSEDCRDVARACVDSSTCSSGCGKTNDPNLRTATCGTNFCYSNFLITGDLTYTALGCDKPRTPLTYSPAAGILDGSRGASTTSTPAGSSSVFTSIVSLSTPQATDSSSPGSNASNPTPFRTQTSNGPELPTSGPALPTSDPAPGTSSSSNAGAIAGGVVGGLAVVSIAGLVFYFLKKRVPKPDAPPAPPAELGPPTYQQHSAEKLAHNAELPGEVAAAELPLVRDPVELHADDPYAKTAAATRP